MKIFPRAVLLLGLLLLVAALWLGLHRTEQPATWLLTEAPPHAIEGQMLLVRVTLTAPTGDTRLAVDLHGTSSRREPRGLVSTSRPRRVDRHESTYEFELPVPVRDDLGYVSAILFLSQSGRWADRTAVAATAWIPVRTSGALEPAEPVPVYEQRQDAAPRAAAAPALRYGIAGFWLLCSLSLWRRRTGVAAGRLAIACFAAALWELSNAEVVLAEVARAAAFAQRLYYERFWLQEAVTLAIFAAAAVLLASVLLRSPDRRRGLVPAALGLYAAISLAGLVSFHETDRLLALSVLSVPLAQLAKLGVAFAALAFALRLRPRESAAAPAAAAARSAAASPRAE